MRCFFRLSWNNYISYIVQCPQNKLSSTLFGLQLDGKTLLIRRWIQFSITKIVEKCPLNVLIPCQR
jgi:hypothetical protein